jgi:hypothetical protein
MHDSWSAFRPSPRLLGALVLVFSVFAILQFANGSSEVAARNVETRLRAGNSGKCLNTYPGDQRNGAVAYQWTCGSGNNIELVDAGGGWHYIKFTHSDKCLTVNGYAWWDGATLDQWTCVGQSNQKWSGAFVDGFYEVHFSQANPTKCITVHQESTANGAIVNQWQCLYQANQAWQVQTAGPAATATPTRTPTATPVPGDGELTITKQCDPTTAKGEFVFRVGNIVVGTIGCGESIGPITLAAGTYRVSEAAGPGTDLDDWDTTFNGDCDDEGDVTIEEDEEETCVVENELENPT